METDNFSHPFSLNLLVVYPQEDQILLYHENFFNSFEEINTVQSYLDF